MVEEGDELDKALNMLKTYRSGVKVPEDQQWINLLNDEQRS